MAYRMDVGEYQRLCPYAEALEENWGKPPGAALQLLMSCKQQSRISISPDESPNKLAASFELEVRFDL